MSPLNMTAIARALMAWQRRDMNAVAEALTPVLPTFPIEEGPRSDTRARVIFHTLLPSLALPPALEAYGRLMLDRASDRQLDAVADQVRVLADTLDGRAVVEVA